MSFGSVDSLHTRVKALEEIVKNHEEALKEIAEYWRQEQCSQIAKDALKNKKALKRYWGCYTPKEKEDARTQTSEGRKENL